MSGIETFIILTVAALYFAIVPWSKWTNQFVLYTMLLKAYLKNSRLVRATIRAEALGKFLTVVCLNTFNRYASPLVPSNEFLKKIGRRVCALFTVRCQEAKSGKLIYSGVLIQF